MEKTKKGLSANKALMAGAALISLSAGALNKANAATGTGNMNAIVLTPIAVVEATALHFGTLTETATGTVVITAAGVRSATGGVSLVTGAGLETNGVLNVSGATGVNIDFDLVAPTANYTVNDGGANTMIVNGFNFVTDAGGTNEVLNFTASPFGVNVGATLNVGSPQTPGTYTGTYQVTANYQ